MLQALSEMKTEKAHGPSDVSMELIAASMAVVMIVMAEICQHPRLILNVSMGSMYNGSNLQWEV